MGLTIRACAIVLPIGMMAMLVVSIGCGRKTLARPGFDPATAADEAIALYDANRDGAIDATEAERSPPIRAALSRADTDGDGRLTQPELAARFQKYLGDDLLVTTFPCRVTLDGRPLAGADVALVPEAFMGKTYERATGTTSAGGQTALSTPSVTARGFSGAFCGMYRLEISRKNPQGQETVPSRYNSESELGQEIAPDVPDLERGVTIDLKQR